LNEPESPYDRLIQPIEARMMGTIVRIVGDGDDACDVFQEVLASVWARMGRITAHSNPHGYILRICVARAYDVLRKRARRREVAMPGQIEARPVEDTPEVDHLAARVRQALGRLPRKQAQAVLLKLFDDAPYETIAEVLRCSKATARSHVSKGLARLRSDSELILALQDKGDLR
jgi:RNA polymerase sigma factor (sigma-70 family)